MQDAVAAVPIFCGGGRCVLKLLRSNNITHCTSIFDCACTFTITIISHCTAVHAKDMGSLLYYAFLCLFYSRIVVLICRSFAGLGLAGLAGQPPPIATVAANQPAVPLSHVNEPATIRISQPNKPIGHTVQCLMSSHPHAKCWCDLLISMLWFPLGVADLPRDSTFVVLVPWVC